jgi:hypothetical protein
MKRLCILLAAGVVSAAVSASASQIDITKLPAPAKESGVTYEKDIKPMLEASCVRCHGPERPKAGLRLDSLGGLLKGSKDGQVVLPGDSAKSLVVLAVSQLDPKIAMPPKPRPPKPGPEGAPASTNAPGANPPHHPMGPPPKPLTSDQVGLLRAWIDQGAK